MAQIDVEDAPSQTVTLADVFRNRNFALLWVGQVVAYLGDNFFKMAIVAMVTFTATTQEEKSERQNWVTILGNVPYFIFPLFLATLIERTDRRWLLIWMDIYRALLIFVCAFLISSKSPEYVPYTLVFFVYAGTSLFFPAKSLFITEIVRPEHLLRANSVSTTVGALMALFGTLIGTRLVEWFGYTNTLLITVGAYIFSMATLWLINSERQGQVRTDAELERDRTRKSKGAIAELVEGWNVTRTNPIAFSSVMMYAWIWGVVGSFFALLTAMIYERLAPLAGRSGNEDALNFQGEVLGLVGVALFVGGVLVGRMAAKIPLRQLLTSSFVGAGFTITLLAVPGVLAVLWLPLALFFLLGAFGGSILIPLETAIGKGVPREVRGRVFAFNTVFHTIFLTGVMTLTNVYLSQTKGWEWRIEFGCLLSGVVAMSGAWFTLWFPKRMSLAELTPDVVASKG